MQNIPTLSILLIIGSLFIVLSISEQMSISNTLIKINNKLAKIFLFVIGVVFILFSLIHLFSIDIDLGNINIGKSSIKHEDINEIMIKARAGDSHYQAILGANYRRGYQVKQSFPLAKEWLKKSLKATDNPIALYNMAYLYQHGQGVKKDLNKSQNLYAKSYIGLVELSKSGDIRAKVNLGAMYRDGNGIIQDPKKALVLFKEANNKNYYLAQFTLANLYETSELVKTSCEKAISLYKKSAMQNYVLAAYALGGIYWGKGKCSKNVQIHDINKWEPLKTY